MSGQGRLKDLKRIKAGYRPKKHFGWLYMVVLIILTIKLGLKMRIEDLFRR